MEERRRLKNDEIGRSDRLTPERIPSQSERSKEKKEGRDGFRHCAEFATEEHQKRGLFPAKKERKRK